MQSCLPPHRPARIVALREDIHPAKYLLKSPICMIGRADSCQIQIPQKTISRIHTIIRYDPQQGHLLYDNHTANGTYVNGQRIYKPYHLQDQDEIGLSAACGLLRFEIATPTGGNTEDECAN